MSQRDFAGEADEPGAFVGAGAGQPEVFIDDDDLFLGPAQLRGSIGQGVLPRGGFAVMLDLAWSGLANVNEGGAWVCEALILEESVIGLLLVLVAGCFD